MKNVARFVFPTAGAMLLATMLGPISAANAAPEDACDTALCTIHAGFESPGLIVHWIVPEGVHELTLDVAAGSGAGSSSIGFAPGGAGGHVAGIVAVEPGDELVFVAGQSGGATSEGLGGYGGGGNSTFGGGGGGGSFVFIETAGGAWAPLLVAGGGGGGSTRGGPSAGADGGFSGSGPDAAPATVDSHAQGGTTSGPAHDIGVIASFDGTAFTGGNGGHGNPEGGGGGGYYGGAGGTSIADGPTIPNLPGGGGGSGYASDDVDVISQAANTGDGFVEVAYANPQTDAQLSVHPGSSRAGETLTLTGSISQLSAGGTGTLTFTGYLGTQQMFTRSVAVTTTGTGPYTASTEVTYTPLTAGSYVFTLEYADTGTGVKHNDAVADDVTVSVSAGAVGGGDELAATGASGADTVLLAIVGAGLLIGGSAMPILLERRAHRRRSL